MGGEERTNETSDQWESIVFRSRDKSSDSGSPSSLNLIVHHLSQLLSVSYINPIIFRFYITRTELDCIEPKLTRGVLSLAQLF